MGKDGGKQGVSEKTRELLPVFLLPAGNLLSAAFRPADVALRVLFLSLIGAAAEEFFFRGFLLKTILLPRLKPCFAILGTAVLFAVMHLLNLRNGTPFPAVLPQMFCAFCFSVWAGAVVWRTGSVRLPLIAHLLLNLTAVTDGTLLPVIASVLVLADGVFLMKTGKA